VRVSVLCKCVRVKFEIFFLPCSPLFLSVRTEEEERLFFFGFQYLFFFFFLRPGSFFGLESLSSFLVLDGLLLGLLLLLLFLKVVFWLIDVLSPSFSLWGNGLIISPRSLHRKKGSRFLRQKKSKNSSGFPLKLGTYKSISRDCLSLVSLSCRL